MSRHYDLTIEDRASDHNLGGALPTAEELAGPIVSALSAIKEAFDGRADNLAHLRLYGETDARPAYDREAHECVETSRRLERIVSTVATGIVDGSEPAHVTALAGAVATIMPVLTDVRHLDAEINELWFDLVH